MSAALLKDEDLSPSPLFFFPTLFFSVWFLLSLQQHVGQRLIVPTAQEIHCRTDLIRASAIPRASRGGTTQHNPGGSTLGAEEEAAHLPHRLGSFRTLGITRPGPDFWQQFQGFGSTAR